MKDQDFLDQTSAGQSGEKTATPSRPKPLDEQTQLFHPAGPPGAAAPPEGFPKPMLDDGQATVAFKPFKDLKKEEAALQPTLELISGQANQKILNLGREKLKGLPVPRGNLF
jgi:hypothetical protein